METVIQKILSSADFRKALINDPVATLKAEGVDANAEILAALEGADEAALEELANNFMEDKAAS